MSEHVAATRGDNTQFVSVDVAWTFAPFLAITVAARHGTGEHGNGEKLSCGSLRCLVPKTTTTPNKSQDTMASGRDHGLGSTTSSSPDNLGSLEAWNIAEHLVLITRCKSFRDEPRILGIRACQFRRRREEVLGMAAHCTCTRQSRQGATLTCRVAVVSVLSSSDRTGAHVEIAFPSTMYPIELRRSDSLLEPKRSNHPRHSRA